LLAAAALAVSKIAELRADDAVVHEAAAPLGLAL
jgi:hypothetical protein